jgi:predicted RNase H-like HicB family nuclease
LTTAGLPTFLIKSCSAMGDTPEEALAEVREAMSAWLEVSAGENQPIPESRYRPAIDAANANSE